MKKNYRLTVVIASVMIGLFALQLVPVKTIDGHDNIVQAGFCDDTDLDYIVDGAYSRIPEKITKSFEDDKNTDIVNSVKTEIEIMKAVFSIIGILVTSNQFICKGLV